MLFSSDKHEQEIHDHQSLGVTQYKQILLCKNAFLTSNYFIGQHCTVAIVRMIRIVTSFITGLKVSEKSLPTAWLNPFPTILALSRSSDHLPLILF